MAVLEKTSLAVLAASLLLPAAAARAEGLVVTYAATIYADQENQRLNAPEGVACGAGGRLVIADTGNARLVSYAMKDGIPDGGSPLKLDEVRYPTRLQLDGEGSLLVLDRRKKQIARVDLSTRKFAGWVELPAPATGAVVGAFALDGARNLYVYEITTAKVSVLDPAGKVTRTIDVPRGAAIRDLAVDGGGKLYAVDAIGAMVWTADRAETAFKPLTKSLKDVMSFPAYVTLTKGRIYLVDENGGGVVILGQDGSYLGRRLAYGWNEGLVRYPAQLCISEAGEAILADRQNNRVQVFSMK
jgi:hypothetical protein